MGIFSVISNIIKPVREIIDDLHTSQEEKENLKNEIAKVEYDFQNRILEYEGKLTEAQSKIILAETQATSWIQRNWRPITMLTFLILVVCDSFGLLTFRLADQAWTLLQIGLGGYVIGRSAEKIVPYFQGENK